MRVVHFCPFSPSKSGMYESTKDQIKYERIEGLDSQLIDPIRPNFVDGVDGYIRTIDFREAMDADVWVVHSNIPPPLKEYIVKNREKHVTVAIMHGPIENMLLKEWAYLEKNIEEEGAFTITHINWIWNHDACVVIDKHAWEISKIFDEYNKLHYIPNSIDLERNPVEGYKWEYLNHPAIISCDVPRIEKLPVHILFSMPGVLERIPTARLSMFALPLVHIEFFRNLVCRSKERQLDFKCCENIQMKMSSLEPFIRGADIGFNSNYSGICSRVHMEMMAMGVPVVSYNGDYTEYHARAFDILSIAEQIEKCWNDLQSSDLRYETIEYAHQNFDRAYYVKDYVNLYKKLLEEKK